MGGLEFQQAHIRLTGDELCFIMAGRKEVERNDMFESEAVMHLFLAMVLRIPQNLSPLFFERCANKLRVKPLSKEDLEAIELSLPRLQGRGVLFYCGTFQK